jgi:hypothetical protein
MMKRTGTKMKKTQILIRMLGMMGTVWAIGAQAALINIGDELTLNNAGTYGGPIDVNKAETGYVQYNAGPLEHVYAGAFELNVVNHSQAGNSFTIFTFCTDVGVNWRSGKDFDAVQFAGQTGVNPTWSAVPQAIENAEWIYNNYFIVPGLGSITTSRGAAVQLAIWKVLYDTAASGQLSSTSFGSGLLRANGFSNPAILDATAMLTAVNAARSGGTFTAYLDTWLSPINDTLDSGPLSTQGMIYNPSTPVPEPSTIIAGVLLLLPFGASTIRFVRKNRIA